MNENSDEKIMKEIEEFTVWENLGTVDTIYEEDYEFSSSSSSLSPPLSPPPPPPPHLHSRVHQWSKITGLKTDVCIRVNGKCFHLHKDPLASKSPHLKRQLATAPDITLSPPLKITAETFTLVADFCYGARIVITPFNVAALRTAAELLEMADDEEESSLVHVTEKYFRRVVAVNRDYAAVVFRSCLELLPEAETTAFLGSRCLQAWSLEDNNGDGNFDIICFEDLKCVEVENFMVLASSLNRRFKCHDFIYKIALLYLKGYSGKITEEQKVLLCNLIDCDKLSPKLLLHAVQNPAMPLRFVVRAMLIEQLNTRHSIFSTTTIKPRIPPTPRPPIISKDPLTLGAILKRDAAARESAKLKAAMHATNTRIRTLENQLSNMKMKLQQSDSKDHQRRLSQDSARGRSASFHHGVENGKVVARGQRGSSSSSVSRMSADFTNDFKLGGGCKPVSNNDDGGRELIRSIGQRLINGIKNVFRVSGSDRGRESEISKVERREDEDDDGGEDLYGETEDGDGDGDIVVMRRNQLYVN